MTEWFAIEAPASEWPAVGDDVKVAGAPPPNWMTCLSPQGICTVLRPGDQTRPGYITAPVTGIVTTVTPFPEDGPEFAIVEIN